MDSNYIKLARRIAQLYQFSTTRAANVSARRSLISEDVELNGGMWSNASVASSQPRDIEPRLFVNTMGRNTIARQS